MKRFKFYENILFSKDVLIAKTFEVFSPILYTNFNIKIISQLRNKYN